MVADTPVIKRFTVRLETRATAVNLRDYDFRKPRLALESAVIGEQLPSLEEQRYPGHFTDRPHGKHLAQRALSGTAATTARPMAAAIRQCWSAVTSSRWPGIHVRSGMICGW